MFIQCVYKFIINFLNFSNSIEDNDEPLFHATFGEIQDIITIQVELERGGLKGNDPSESYSFHLSEAKCYIGFNFG